MAWRRRNCMILNALSSIFFTNTSTVTSEITQIVICEKCKVGRATWGIPGLSKEWIMKICTACSRHTRNTNLQKLNGRCIKCTHSAIFGTSKALHCREHMEAGDIDRVHPKCSFHGCSRTQPAWGDEHGVARFCREHKLPRHIFLNKRTCKHPGCPRTPSFGCAGNYDPKHKHCQSRVFLFFICAIASPIPT